MFENNELTAWLEECVKMFLEQDKENPIVSGAVVVLQENRNVMTGYYNCDAQDKAIFAHNMNADAMLDIVCNNADIVKQAIEEADEDDQGEAD